MSWGYKHSTATFAQELQRNKQLIGSNELGTKVYSSSIGNGMCKDSIKWHDNRKTKFPSILIINHKAFNIDNLKTQKEIFEYAEDKLKELKIISTI